MFEIEKFLAHDKTMLIAPAGYGKTHCIAASMTLLKWKGKHLILTHTHAGIASIKEKLKKEGVASSCFHVETISGFAQRYVLSFYSGKDIPIQTEKNYFNFILEKAFHLFSLKPVKKILLRSYSSLFVDEYQDCTQKQHKLVELIAMLIPTRFLGDPLQGIFQFDPLDPLIDMNNKIQMREFSDNQYVLTEPQRWLRGNNSNLGNALKTIRQELIASTPINLDLYPAIVRHYFKEEDLNDPTSEYYKVISFALNLGNILIIHPISSSIQPRLNLIKKFKNRFVLLEAIDDKDFYRLASKFDQDRADKSALTVKEVCLDIFNKTELDKWFNDKGLKSKTKPEEQDLIKPLKKAIDALNIESSNFEFRNALIEVSKLPLLKCYRKEIFSCLCKALQLAHQDKITVLEAMTEIRNQIRRFGKKTNVSCIGTTLLTKGLEFDTVIVLNAHKFECPKHLYVALTRASKKLIVISRTNLLTFKN